MSQNDLVLAARKNGVLTITLNRPERLNALGGTLRTDLYRELQAAEQDAAVRVVVITGAGRAFCSGGDVKEMSERRSKKSGGVAAGVWHVGGGDGHTPPMRDRVLNLMQNMPKPVIASVNGPAVGAGMNLALGCDMRIASERAVFGQAFVKRGLCPDWGGTYFLPRLVGTAKACELIFSGDMLSAEEALQMGLINRLVPHRELQAATEQWARGFAEGPPVAIGLAKRGIYRNLQADLASSLEYETYAQTASWHTEDAGEGIRAFLEKRPAVFQGK